MKKYILKVESGELILHFLFEKTGLSKQKLKQALLFGAVQVKKNNQKKLKRIRRATFELAIGDVVQFFYDEKILSLPAITSSECLYENRDIGVWVKKAGELSQGNQFGDQTSLLRYVEKKKNKAFLVHRLDRETIGVMLFAYNPKAAAFYSDLFVKNKIEKKYYAWVKDNEAKLSESGEIDFKLDGKDSITRYIVIKRVEGAALVDVELLTGRLHQIRRHFSLLGHPVMGDPQYGKDNKFSHGLQLVSYSLSFEEMQSKKKKIISIDPLEYLHTPCFT